LQYEERMQPELCANDESFQVCKQLITAVRAAGSWRLYALRPHHNVLSLRTLAARGRAKPAGLLKSMCDLPDGVVFKVLEYMFGTAGVRVPSSNTTPDDAIGGSISEEAWSEASPDDRIRDMIRTLAETLQISDRVAYELLLSQAPPP